MFPAPGLQPPHDCERGRRHVIKCLALNGATELDRHAEQSFTSEHHYPKPNNRQIIPRIILRVTRNKSRRGQFSDAEVVTMKREIDMKQKNKVETAQQTNEPKVLAGDG